MSTISLGLSGRDLKDKDFFGKSDPYVVISRPNMGGGFEMILTSETKQVKLGLTNMRFDEFFHIIPIMTRHILHSKYMICRVFVENFYNTG